MKGVGWNGGYECEGIGERRERNGARMGLAGSSLGEIWGKNCEGI